jgi:hypothetical protein
MSDVAAVNENGSALKGRAEPTSVSTTSSEAGVPAAIAAHECLGTGSAYPA